MDDPSSSGQVDGEEKENGNLEEDPLAAKEEAEVEGQDDDPSRRTTTTRERIQ